MADKKISLLTNLETSENNDVLAIVDDSEVDISIKTKKQTKENLLKEVNKRIDEIITTTEVGIGTLVGIGNGSEDTFTLPFTPSNPTEVILFVGGAPKFLTDDFILIDGNTKAQFITPPRNDQKIRVIAQK